VKEAQVASPFRARVEEWKPDWAKHFVVMDVAFIELVLLCFFVVV